MKEIKIKITNHQLKVFKKIHPTSKIDQYMYWTFLDHLAKEQDEIAKESFRKAFVE